MKILDPRSGLKQIVTGKIYVPRRKILEYIKREVINPTLLGYFVIAVLSADWSTGEYRYGLIRHSMPKLARLWGIAPSTLSENFVKLLVLGLLTKKFDMFFIIDFDDYQSSGGVYANKNKVSDDQLEQIFGKTTTRSDIPDSSSEIPERQSEISETNSIAATDAIRIPHKDSINTTSRSASDQQARTKAEYQQIYTEGSNGQLLPDDMKWIDDNQKADGSYIP